MRMSKNKVQIHRWGFRINLDEDTLRGKSQHKLVNHTSIVRNSLEEWEKGLLACNSHSFYKTRIL